jgi:hypothetical protein
LRENYGSTEEYLLDHGLAPRAIAALRSSLLEDEG